MGGHTKPLVLVADEDLAVLKVTASHLNRWGCRVGCVSSKVELLAQLELEAPGVLILDLQFGEHDGLELLRQLRQLFPWLPVVLLTGHGSIDSAVTAMKLGAQDYLTKPPDLDRLQKVVAQAVEQARNDEHLRRHANQAEPNRPPVRILGESPAMKRLHEIISCVAPTDATLLILGENGAGKELVARALHEQSPRRHGPFVPVNMAALPRDLAESTLFGHEKGAFTGADRSRIGCCEAADGGTLFLDEIGEMDRALQAKLLRFLQDRMVQRVGSSRSQSVSVRVIAATNSDLQALVNAKMFREDLYYRLNVIPVVVPPLRERREDIPLLAVRFLEQAAQKYHKPTLRLTSPVLDYLSRCDWPGNVRQLENLIERLAILSHNAVIEVADLPPDILPSTLADVVTAFAPPATETPPPPGTVLAMDEMERQTIWNALRQAGGKVREAALLLGLGQATVYRKIKRYGFVLGETTAHTRTKIVVSELLPASSGPLLPVPPSPVMG
jgi:two-component system, NtrC family, response regulator HydG